MIEQALTILWQETQTEKSLERNLRSLASKPSPAFTQPRQMRDTVKTEATLKNPLSVETLEVTKKLTDVRSEIKVLTDPTSSIQFGRHAVIADGNCGYTAFGIDRQEAYTRLNNHLIQISQLLKPAVLELLLREEFYQYLKDNQLIGDQVTHQMITDNLERYAADMIILAAVIDYDVRDKKIDAGWAHPAILQALAHLQGIELYLWQPDTNQQQVVPHRYYPHYSSGQVSERIDLLFVNGNHFDRLERLAPNPSPQTIAKNEGAHEETTPGFRP